VTLEVHVDEEAEGEFRTAFLWYESKRAGLGDEFFLCVEAVFNTIARHPMRHRIVHEDIRKALVRRFPYAVFYVVEPDHIQVIAIFHGSRDPRRWKNRGS